jgi:16S rRNA pseudouridine516 synthase
MYEYIMFHKPSGCITARRDPRHKTVMDYLPKEIRDSHFPVGRLDKDTEGLLLITNDGRLTKSLLSPENKIEKTYYFQAQGVIDPDRMAEVCRGAKIYLNRETKTAPATMEILSTSTIANITEYLSEDDLALARKKPHLPTVEGIVKITEGKKHQVKRMVRFAGARVVYLKRLKMASLTLDESLKKGEARPLKDEEISALFMSVGYDLNEKEK